MTRLLHRKIQYFSSIATLAIAIIGALYWLRAPTWAWGLAGLALLIPGRIAGHYFRNLLTARRLMSSRHHEEALSHLESFLRQIRARPSLKRLIWLQAAVYTRDVEAMALNNIGACELELGNLELVANPLQQALDIDPEYPIPYVNLAMLESLRGNVKGAQAAALQALRLGYRDSRVDTLIHGAAGALAEVEGHGKVRADV